MMERTGKLESIEGIEGIKKLFFSYDSSASSITSIASNSSTHPRIHASTPPSATPYLIIARVEENITDLSALTPREKTEFEKLRTPKRKNEWLSSRLAAKELIRESLGLTVDARIGNDADRKPYAETGGKKFYISISHRDGLCACAVNPELTPFIGVDLEKIEPRSEAWKNDYFTPAETADCGASDEKFIEFWTVKEAALKLLGLGLSVDAREAEVSRGKIKFTGRALNRYEEMGSPEIKRHSKKIGEHIVSVLWA